MKMSLNSLFMDSDFSVAASSQNGTTVTLRDVQKHGEGGCCAHTAHGDSLRRCNGGQWGATAHSMTFRTDFLYDACEYADLRNP